ncbi:MAG: hypothetical protein HQ446_10880 [Polaromonas sp.]|nr:hypothetical protein [Polaromonas sp.]
MKKTLQVLTIGMVSGLLICSTAWSALDPVQADSVARKALALKQYTDVVKAYDGVTPQSLSDQALYRLAIAQQRLGNTLEAEKSLSLALKLNPKGTFASSPYRLASLQQEISKSLPAAPAGPVAAVVAGKAVTLLEPSVLASAQAINASIPKNQPTATQAPAAPPAGRVLAEPDTAARVTGILFWVVLALLIALAGMSFVMWKLLYSMRVANADNHELATTMKNQLDELAVIYNRPAAKVGSLVALRDEIASMRTLLSAAQRQDSDLSVLLNKLEPLVEMEIGRHLFRMDARPT